MNPPRFSRRSLRDLLEISDYIAKDNPVAAAKTLDRLEEACRQLAATPTIGFPHEEIPEELLVWPVGSYVIIFRIETDGIGIARIVHGARDLRHLFP